MWWYTVSCPVVTTEATAYQEAARWKGPKYLYRIERFCYRTYRYGLGSITQYRYSGPFGTDLHLWKASRCAGSLQSRLQSFFSAKTYYSVVPAQWCPNEFDCLGLSEKLLQVQQQTVGLAWGKAYSFPCLSFRTLAFAAISLHFGSTVAEDVGKPILIANTVI